MGKIHKFFFEFLSEIFLLFRRVINDIKNTTFRKQSLFEHWLKQQLLTNFLWVTHMLLTNVLIFYHVQYCLYKTGIIIAQLCRENSHRLLMLFYLVVDQTATRTHVDGSQITYRYYNCDV